MLCILFSCFVISHKYKHTAWCKQKYTGSSIYLDISWLTLAQLWLLALVFLHIISLGERKEKEIQLVFIPTSNNMWWENTGV